MAIVNCPECSKKLKVADTSIGKKVKCSCGTVFVAKETEAPAAPPPASPSVAEKVLVACTECASKLKVAATSLGKKMKCPKCAGIFVASLPAAPVAEETPPSLASKPAADEEEAPLVFASDESKDADEDEEEMPKPKVKPRKKPVDEEEEKEVMPQPAGKPVYPSRLVVNLVVVFLVLAYGAFFAATYPGFGAAPLLDLGLVKDRTVQPIQLPGPIPPLAAPGAGGKKGGPGFKGKGKNDQGAKEELKKDDAKKDSPKNSDPEKKPPTDPDKDKNPEKDKEQGQSDRMAPMIHMGRGAIAIVTRQDEPPFIKNVLMFAPAVCKAVDVRQ